MNLIIKIPEEKKIEYRTATIFQGIITEIFKLTKDINLEIQESEKTQNKQNPNVFMPRNIILIYKSLG